MSKPVTFCVLMLLLVIAAAGCGDDPAAPPPGGQSSFQVNLDPQGDDFTIKLESVETPDGTARGPFFLRGTNLHYNDVIGALTVDLTITNNSEVTFENPVAITFLRLLPDSTRILNSPDDGPRFEFEFANDDLWWTPGEESLPLTVMFKADPGVSVGFNAHISVGGTHAEGLISGRVWHDLNRNGMMDEGEPGIPDITIDIDDGTDREILRRAVTDGRGRYQYRHLDPGAYEVRVLSVPVGMSSTTPLNMHVLLSRDPGGGTGSFTEADFGFVEEDIVLPGPKLVVDGSQMEPLVAFRGETVMFLSVHPGIPLEFHWQGTADPGLEIAAYRWGWDVIDPDDPQDPGWAQARPGLGRDYQHAAWGGTVDPGGSHRLVVHCWDNLRHLTRVMIDFRVDPPDSLYD